MEKQKLTVTRFRRLKVIHEKLKNKKYPNQKTLAALLGVSKVTIRRDFEFLRDEYLLNIEFSRSHNGFYYDGDSYLPLFETIKSSEIEVLASAKLLLSHYQNTPLYDNAMELINTLISFGKKNNEDELLLNRMAVAPIPLSNINEGTWKLIKMAMKEGRKLCFDYENSDWDPDLIHRTVRPYQIVLDEGKCFLFGYLDEKEDVRLFKLDKMKNIVISGEKFILPSLYQFDKMCGGGKFGAFTRFTPKKYKIAFYEDARESIRNGYWAEDQEFTEDDENNCTIITFTSSQDMRILDWVFMNKAYAVPIEPKEFVEKWRYNVKVMAQEASLLPLNDK